MYEADLDEIAAALERAAYPVALALTLEAWRRRRWTALADLVDALDTRCLTEHPSSPLDWCDRATRYDPVDAGSLISWLDLPDPKPLLPELVVRRAELEAPVHAVRHAGNNAVRIAYLCSWPADPRITEPLIQWCERLAIRWPRRDYEYGGPYGLAELGRWFAIVATTMRGLADRRFEARLRALADEPPGRSLAIRGVQAEVALAGLATIERLEVPEPSTTDRARIEALIDRIGRRVRAAAPPRESFAATGLWERIANAPDDDEARLVLADALLEVADPRGQVFALQLRAAGKRHVAALIKRNWHAWLGEDLAHLITRRGTTWARGMFDVIRVGAGSTPAYRIDRVAGHRELVAVRGVRLYQLHPPDYARFVAALPNVRIVMVDSPEIASALVAHGVLAAITTVVVAPRSRAAAMPCVAPLAGNVPSLTTLALEAPVNVEEVRTLCERFPGVELVLAGTPVGMREVPPGIRIGTFSW
ncbi:MAG: hypothetical protein ABI867_19440 [Kofleriaceae bacterium]